MCRFVNTSVCVGCLCGKMQAVALPYRLGETCTVGAKRVSDNTCYVCLKDHVASPEIFIGAPEYWQGFYENLPVPEPAKLENKKLNKMEKDSGSHENN